MARVIKRFKQDRVRHQNGSQARQIANHLRGLFVGEALELTNSEGAQSLAFSVGIGVGVATGREFATEHRANCLYVVRTK